MHVPSVDIPKIKRRNCTTGTYGSIRISSFCCDIMC